MTEQQGKITLTVAALAKEVEAELIGDGKGMVTGVNSLAQAGETEVSFVTSQQYAGKIGDSKAIAVIVSKEISEIGIAQLVVGNVDAALIKALTTCIVEAGSTLRSSSPTVSNMSSSRRGGSGFAWRARAVNSSVCLPMALTTTTSR